MSVDDTVKLIEATSKLLSILVWPLVALFILIRFGPALRELVATLGEFTLKYGDFEWSAKRQKAEAAEALAAATASRPEAGATPETAAKKARAAAKVVAEIVTPRVMRRAAGSTVLWVDDQPNNNIHERQALEALGVRFALATSTNEALEQLKQHPVDAIISDMGRPPDSQAGYALLDALRTTGNSAPFLIYAGSSSSEQRAEARRRGAAGCTNRPDELFEMVLSVLGRSS